VALGSEGCREKGTLLYPSDIVLEMPYFDYKGEPRVHRVMIGENILEARCKTRGLHESGECLMFLRVRQFWLIVFQTEVHVVVLGFTAHSKSSGLQAREKNSDKFTERGRVQYSDSFRCASRYVVRIYSTSRHRTLSFITNLVYPAMGC
jgi:hypothetical protein